MIEGGEFLIVYDLVFVVMKKIRSDPTNSGHVSGRQSDGNWWSELWPEFEGSLMIFFIYNTRKFLLSVASSWLLNRKRRLNQGMILI